MKREEKKKKKFTRLNVSEWRKKKDCPVVYRLSGNGRLQYQEREREQRKRLAVSLGTLLLALLVVWLAYPSLLVQAGELVEETYQKSNHLYDKYKLENYSLDFYVDTSGDWLPWNWGEGIGKSIYAALFELTNVIWFLTRLFSYFIGFLIEEAYDLDFISSTVDYLAVNLQKLAGVSPSGFRSHGLFPSVLPIAVLVVGIYFFYQAVVKQSFSKAVSSLVTFVVVAVFGMGIIAYSGQYLGMVNTFQKEFNQEVLKNSETLTLGNGTGTGTGTASIRDSLFSIMVYEPYLLLQYGTVDEEELGADRIEELLEAEAGSAEREEVARTEAVDRENEQLGIAKVASRLGSVLLIFLLDVIIGVCVGIFTGVMIFSQFTFVLYVSFIPVVILIAMFPNSTSGVKRLLEKTFGALLKKGWITIILSVVFGFSTMCYQLTGSKNFLWTMFLQVVLYVGAVTKSGELFGFLSFGGERDNSVKRAGGKLSSAVRTAMLGNVLKNQKKLADGRDAEQMRDAGDRTERNRKSEGTNADGKQKKGMSQTKGKKAEELEQKRKAQAEKEGQKRSQAAEGKPGQKTEGKSGQKPGEPEKRKGQYPEGTKNARTAAEIDQRRLELQKTEGKTEPGNRAGNQIGGLDRHADARRLEPQNERGRIEPEGTRKEILARPQDRKEENGTRFRSIETQKNGQVRLRENQKQEEFGRQKNPESEKLERELLNRIEGRR